MKHIYFKKEMEVYYGVEEMNHQLIWGVLKKSFPKLDDITIRNKTETKEYYFRIKYGEQYYELIIPYDEIVESAYQQQFVVNKIGKFLEKLEPKKKVQVDKKLVAYQKKQKKIWMI